MSCKGNKIPDQYVLFGAGNFGRVALSFIGKDRVKFFVDNNEYLENGTVEGISIFCYIKHRRLLEGEKVVICVSEQYADEIMKQLEKDHISYLPYVEIKKKIIEERINESRNNIDGYNLAIDWVYRNTVGTTGIATTTALRKPYPEVTGYFIPTLIRWGHRDLAIQYAKWLCHAQKPDGSWYNAEDTAPYIFDSAQVLKGLISIREILPDVDPHIIKGCEWILSNMQADGKLLTPTKEAWGDNTDFVDEIIHIYCLSPLIDAGEIFNRPDFKEKADRIFDYYLMNYREKITEFNLMSHFYAYVLEALIDLDKKELLSDALDNLKRYQRDDGAIPAYNNVDWVCSTGLLQMAMIWFRKAEFERGEMALRYAMGLQNASGGWFGSYPFINGVDIPDYLPDAEISWAVKFFLDALYYRMNAGKTGNLPIDYWGIIKETDGRYAAISNCIEEAFNAEDGGLVCDVGCGLGRYMSRLKNEKPNNKYFGVDPVCFNRVELQGLGCEVRQGILTEIPYENNFFDIVYACESLEHSVDIKSAIREMARVTKSGGWIAIIDKDIDHLGALRIDDWEQWFSRNELKDVMSVYCENVEVVGDITADGDKEAIFCLWKGKVK